MIYFVLLFTLIIVVFQVGTSGYSNPYTLTMFIGKKGSGKTTTMCKLAYRYRKKGWSVYSNVQLPGCVLLGDNDLGRVHIPPDSLILWDEAGMKFDNRNFKNFSVELRDYFKLQRHYKHKVMLFSQAVDVGLKIRNLLDDMFLLERRFRIFSYGKRIIKKITLTEAAQDRPSTVAENLKFDSIVWFWCGSRMLTLIPCWTGSFDTFEAPQLRDRHLSCSDSSFEPLSCWSIVSGIICNCFSFVGNLFKRFSFSNRVASVPAVSDQPSKQPPMQPSMQWDLKTFFTTPVDRR